MFRKYVIPRPALDSPIQGVTAASLPLLEMCVLYVPTFGGSKLTEAERALPEDAEPVGRVVACLSYDSVAELGAPPVGVAHDNRIGLGVPVYLLDTGVSSHAEFGGRLKAGFNSTLPGAPRELLFEPFFEPSPSFTRDLSGHGTHMSAIAAGSTVGSSRADVLPVKVLSVSGAGTVDSVLFGLEWVLSQPDPGVGFRGVVCAGFSCLDSGVLDLAFSRVARAGYRVALSANTAGEGSHNLAHESGAILVGGITASQEKFAKYGTADLWAPAWAESAWIDGNYRAMAGTSVAVAFVAGLLTAQTGEELVSRATPLLLPSGDSVLMATP